MERFEERDAWIDGQIDEEVEGDSEIYIERDTEIDASTVRYREGKGKRGNAKS